MDTEPPKKINFFHVFLNRFAERGGIKAILDIVFQKDGDMTPAEPMPSPAYCHFYLIFRIIRFIEPILKELQPEIRYQLVMELKERVEQRVKKITDKEIKEFEIEILKKVFDKIELFIELDVVRQTTFDLEANHQLPSEIDPKKKILLDFYQFRETEELNLYYRFIESPSFDKKLKGINGIREFISRLEIKAIDEKKPNKKPLNYFTEQTLVNWLLESRLIELIYVKNNNIELIKRSADVLKFLGENTHDFPLSIIDTIWNSIGDKREEIVTTIYGVIVDLGSSLELRPAQYMYRKFLEVKYEDYDDDFINLIGRYTEKCIRLVAFKTKDGKVILRDIPEDLQTHKFFGIPLMFNLMMDDTPLNSRLSQKVIDYLLNIISDYPAPSLLSNIREKCIENIMNGISVYQSLFVLRPFFVTAKPHDEFLTQFEETHNILDYIADETCSYVDKVREKSQEIINAMGREKFEQLFRDEPFIGKFGHFNNICERFNALRFFGYHPHLSKQLSLERIVKLWKTVVLHPVFNFERNYFLTIISEMYNKPNKEPEFLIRSDQITNFLLEVLCNPELFDVQNFTEEKFTCLETYFKFVNIKERKILLTNEMDYNPLSQSFVVVDKNLIGLDHIWRYLVECPNTDLIEKFTTLLVNIYTKLGEELQMAQQEVYRELIETIMNSIAEYNHRNELSSIERYILFLGKFFSMFERKRSPNYYRIGQSENNNPLHKVKCTAKFRDYNLSRQFDFSMKERLGYIKEVLALNFEVEGEIEVEIDGTVIGEDDMFRELKDVVTQGIIYVTKKPSTGVHVDPKKILSSERRYLDIFLSIFENREPSKNVSSQ